MQIRGLDPLLVAVGASFDGAYEPIALFVRRIFGGTGMRSIRRRDSGS